LPQLPKVIIWMDPGQTTGLASWIRDDVLEPMARRDGSIFTPEQFEVVQVPECQTENGLVALRSEIQTRIAYGVPLNGSSSVVIGYETFDWRHEERYRDKIDYTAPEVVGAIRAWALEWKYASTLCTGAGLAKGFWNDDKLKRAGLYTPGKRHAMDALRHLLRYLTFGLHHQEYLMRLRPPTDG
jgi:hypothetical protein